MILTFRSGLLNVKFAVIEEVKTGVSKCNGKAYKVQNVIVEWDEPTNEPEVMRTQRLKCRLRGASVDTLQRLNPVPHVTEVPVEISFDTELYNGYVQNNVTLWLMVQ